MGEKTMAAVKQMNVWEQKYYDITELYALNEALLATVESAANPEAQLELIAPLVETLGESTDVLTDEYIGLCEGNPARKKNAKGKIEGALRKAYMALSGTAERIKSQQNAAIAIMKRIKQQLEQVIVHFVEFVQLSLDRIMQKHDMDALKQRHASISLMLHGMSLAKGNN